MILELTSAPKTTLSVSASPRVSVPPLRVESPSTVRLPVTVAFPVTSKLPATFKLSLTVVSDVPWPIEIGTPEVSVAIFNEPVVFVI